MPDFSQKRLIFLKPAHEKQPETVAQKTGVENTRDNADKALLEALAEKTNIELSFGPLDEENELPAGTPETVVKQYKKLIDVIRKLKAAKWGAKKQLEESIATFEEVIGSLEEWAAKPESSPGKPFYVQGDPMAVLGYKPLRRILAEPAPAQEKAEPVSAEAQEKAPAKSGPKKPETAEIDYETVFLYIAERAERGDKKVSAEEISLIKKELAPGILHFIDGQNGTSYDFEISSNKKYLRINGNIPKDGNNAQASFTSVIALEEGVSEKPKFKYKTADELTAEKIDTNRNELDQQLLWLESESTPPGSLVIISSTPTERKNAKGETEKGYSSIAVVKGAQRLRITTLEYYFDESGKPIGKKAEKNVQEYDLGRALDLVTVHTPVAYEGTNEEKESEVTATLNSLAYKLVAYLPLGGPDSPNFRRVLSDFARICQQYGKTEYIYHDRKILGMVVKLKGGKVTLYEPKSEPETTGKKHYAVHSGPYDLNRFA